MKNLTVSRNKLLLGCISLFFILTGYTAFQWYKEYHRLPTTQMAHSHYERSPQLQRQTMLMIVSATFLLLFVLLYFFMHLAVWKSIILASLLLVSCIALLWYCAEYFGGPLLYKHRVYDQQELAHIDSKAVPTGIYVKELDFVNPEMIELVAYVWQRYTPGVHDGISRGFIMPQLAGSLEIQTLTHHKRKDVETIIWHVNAKLSQSISYTLYPFDRKTLHIQLRHKDFDKNIRLIPDLGAYPDFAQETTPGVSKYLFMSGWHAIESFFSFHYESFGTNFGIYGGDNDQHELVKAQTPALGFNVTVKRYLIETLLTQLFPLMVIALMLFLIYFSDILQGFSSYLSSIGGIFFGTIVAHLSFRNKIPPNEVVYFETFYLILYAFMLIIIMLSMLDLYNIRVPWLPNRYNNTAKLLFWPFLLGTIVLVTVWYLA